MAPNNTLKPLMLIFLLVPAGVLSLNAQVYTNKPSIRVDKQTRDSVKQAVEYPYILPILGEKAAKAGFDLPYSAGLGVNYLWQESELIINNLAVGFNHGPLHSLDEIVRFDKAVSTASAINFRPDVWVLPFLNVYGVFARSAPSTIVDFSVWVPNQDGDYSKAASFHTQANFQATTMGFGLTPTIGVKGGWLALDMNVTWNDIPQLAKPAVAFVFGPRLGKTFKLKKPDRTLTFWAGGFRLHLNSGTSGSLNLNEIVDTNGLQAKVDAGIQTVSDKQTEVDTWWGGLSSIEQQNPVNTFKHDTANRVLNSAGSFLGNMDTALNDATHSSVQYSLDKRPKDMWNFIVGSQFQLNKSWMIRAEYGFMGSRQQFIGGLQYRFPL